MTLGKPEKTCEELYDESREKAAECFDMVVNGGSLGDVNQLLRAFFTPDHSVDPEQQRLQNAMYLFCREPCGVAKGNNACKKCVRAGCADSCECPEYVEISTGCDDPNQCDTYVTGWNYTALARAAEYAASLTYMPTRIRDPRPGDVLTWDKDAVPDNEICDPCTLKQRGAWVNKPAPQLVRDQVEQIIRDTVDAQYITDRVQGIHP